MIRMIPCLMLMICVAIERCDSPASISQPTATVREIATVSLSQLVEAGRQSQLDAFDIAPDGRLLAMLYPTWNAPPTPPRREEWLTIWDIPSHKTLRSIRFVAADLYRNLTGKPRRLIFTADQRNIVAIAQEKLFVVGTETGAVTLVTHANSEGLPVEIQTVNGSIVAVSYHQEGQSGFYTELLDCTSLKAAGGWHLPTVPQSFSPDGKLAVTLAVREWNKGGVAGLQILDATTGAKLKSIAVGFGFKHRWSNEGGTVIARFLDNQRIVVTPDHMIDHTGHHSGFTLEVINTSQNQIAEEITPPHFVPGGDLVVSQDRLRFAVFSISASAWAFHHESPNPKDYKHEIFIYARDGSKLEGVIEDVYFGISGGAEAMRVSADGSLVAFAGDLIKVFQLSKKQP